MQSLQSAGRPQETTFTSFEPFSPPSNTNANSSSNANGYTDKLAERMAHRLSDSASVASYTSSKRSRSIYAPDRHNSVADATVDGAHNQDNDADIQTYSSGVSIASRSLHAVLMDQGEESRPALFPDNLNAYRTNPQALGDMSSADLATFIYREGGAENIIKTLAKDLAEKDAEVAILRRKNDKYAFLFKEHLTTVHQMSRLEADKKVQSHFPDPSEDTRTYSEEVQDALADALDDPFGDHNTIPQSSADSIKSASAAPNSPRTVLVRNNSVMSDMQDYSARSSSTALRRKIVANNVG